jgi:UDP-glucose 6-dehydrogenase
VFNDTFEITNDRSDIIRINEIMKIMDQENIKISQPEMKRKLKEMVGNFDGRKTTISGIQFKHNDNDQTDKDF